DNGVSVFLRHEMLRMDIGITRLAEKGFEEAKIQDVYDADPEKFHRAHVLHLMLRVKDWSASEDVRIIREKMTGFRDQLLAGADFGELARKVSEGRAAQQGGDWGWVGKGGETSIDKAMFTVAPGEISDVLSSRVGFHIIKALDRKATFESLKDDIREEMLNEQKMEILMNLTDGIEVRRNPYL
ncbi:MAG: peptidylprolyl isomerase, partial [Verrucomicrobia bacterium]|nr:peptidylprolyl isomerase [Verrucomicrobiota bacterium]